MWRWLAVTDDESRPELFKQVREKDHVVLEAIRDGTADVRSLNAETALTRREINYAFEKLAENGLITVTRPDEYVEEMIDGQRHVYPAPKHAALTDRGKAYFDWTDRTGVRERYDDMDDAEVVRTVRDLEERMDELEQRMQAGFEHVRRQFREQLAETE